MLLDDILITGKDDEEHLKNLAKVLCRLEQLGLQLKKNHTLVTHRLNPGALPMAIIFPAHFLVTFPSFPRNRGKATVSKCVYKVRNLTVSQW